MLERHGLCPAVLATLLLHMCPPAIASAAAQTTPFPWLIAASAGSGSWFSSNIESLTPERESRVVLTAQVHRRLIGRLSAGLTGGTAAILGACAGGCGPAGSFLELGVRVRLVPERAPIWPFVGVGFGVLRQGPSFGLLQASAGLDLFGASRVGLRVEARYFRINRARPRDGFVALLGPSVRF